MSIKRNYHKKKGASSINKIKKRKPLLIIKHGVRGVGKTTYKEEADLLRMDVEYGQKKEVKIYINIEDICREVVEKDGINQLYLLQEECVNLISALEVYMILSKKRNTKATLKAKNKLCEKIADNEIMIKQARLFLSGDDKIDNYKYKKLLRLKKLLSKGDKLNHK